MFITENIPIMMALYKYTVNLFKVIPYKFNTLLSEYVIPSIIILNGWIIKNNGIFSISAVNYKVLLIFYYYSFILLNYESSKN